MSNKKIASKWATEQVNSTSGFVYSDQFFKPFTNFDTHKKIINKLYENNVIAWSDTKDSAFLFKRNDAHLHIESNGHIKAGAWI